MREDPKWDQVKADHPRGTRIVANYKTTERPCGTRGTITKWLLETGPYSTFHVVWDNGPPTVVVCHPAWLLTTGRFSKLSLLEFLSEI